MAPSWGRILFSKRLGRIQCGTVTEGEIFGQWQIRSMMGKTLDKFCLELLGMWQWASKQQKNSVTVASPSPSL